MASQLAQALNHPDLPASGAQRSAVHLAYRQAVGVYCHYDEAEKYMLMAKDIAQASGGRTFDALLELAIVHANRQEFARAVAELESLLHAAPAPGAPGPSPRRLALAHAQLSLALIAVGRTQDAATHRDRALALRSADPKFLS